MGATSITVINAFEMPAGAVPRFLAEWRADRAFLNTQPGFLDGALYESLFENARFRLVNVARWQDLAALEAAYAALRRHHAAQGFYRLAGWKALGVQVNRAVYREALRY
jgi:heme-degrading monooxygenase HmoA